MPRRHTEPTGLRRIVHVALVVLALVLGSVCGARAGEAPAPEQSEKCDDLQNRCLHRENGICTIWHDECMVHHRLTHGPHKSKNNLGGGRKRRV